MPPKTKLDRSRGDFTVNTGADSLPQKQGSDGDDGSDDPGDMNSGFGGGNNESEGNPGTGY